MSTYKTGLRTPVRVAGTYQVSGAGDTVAKVGLGVGMLAAIPLVLIGGLALASVLGGGK